MISNALGACCCMLPAGNQAHISRKWLHAKNRSAGLTVLHDSGAYSVNKHNELGEKNTYKIKQNKRKQSCGTTIFLTLADIFSTWPGCQIFFFCIYWAHFSFGFCCNNTANLEWVMFRSNLHWVSYFLTVCPYFFLLVC